MSDLILIQGAMDVETDWLVSQLEDCQVTAIGAYRFWRGRAGTTELVVSRTGVGMVNCAAATALGIQSFSPALVLNQGVAGSHREDLHTGDVVVGRSCVAIHDLITPQRGRGEGCDPFSWILCDHKSNTAPLAYEADPTWAGRFEAAPCEGGQKRGGRLGSGDIFNRETDRILWLRERAGALCEDMESVATYQVCAQMGVPCLGVRIISNNELTAEPYRREVGIDLQKFILRQLKCT